MLRTCERCGQTYYRRNLMELWNAQNPGHRTGWGKRIIRVCTHCQGANETTRVMTLVRATLSVLPRRRRRRRVA